MEYRPPEQRAHTPMGHTEAVPGKIPQVQNWLDRVTTRAVSTTDGLAELERRLSGVLTSGPTAAAAAEKPMSGGMCGVADRLQEIDVILQRAEDLLKSIHTRLEL